MTSIFILICWIIGHKWKHIAYNPTRFANLSHLHPLAGYSSICKRCNVKWDDLSDGIYFQPDELVKFEKII